MKKIKYFLLAVVMLMSSVSCSDFLSEDTFGDALIEDAVLDATSAELFVYSMYDALLDQYKQWFCVWDTGTDDQSVRKGSGNELAIGMANGNLTETTTNTVQFWDYWWILINRANFIIDTFSESETLSETFITKCVAEARALRGFAYFNLVRLWGDVPVVDWFVERDNYAYTESLDRTKASDVYRDIIFPDLEYASENGVETQAMRGRVTKWFAKTILAEAYMTYAGCRTDCITGDAIINENASTYWTKAREAARDVVYNCNGHSLITEAGAYESAYARIWEEEWGTETLLEIGCISESGYGSYQTWAQLCKATYGSFWGSSPIFENPDATVGVFSVTATYGYAIPTPDLFQAFEEGDLRKWGMLTQYSVDEGLETEIVYTTQPTFRKAIDFDVATGVTGASRNYDAKNMRIYRMADALLIFAEADNEVNGPTGEALTQINKLRDRAGLDIYTATGTQDEWRERIRKERRIELHGENKRRFDLVRWGLLTENTTNYSTVFTYEDNPIMGDIENGSNMSEAGISMYQSTTVHYEYGNSTTLLPPYTAFMCLSTELLEDNPNWSQNFGY